MKRRRKGKINVGEIFQKHPWLRPEQRSVILLLAEKRGGVFEAKIRKTLDLPKSTIWRIIKRLEKESIVEVNQLRGQNHVKLRNEKS